MGEGCVLAVRWLCCDGAVFWSDGGCDGGCVLDVMVGCDGGSVAAVLFPSFGSWPGMSLPLSPSLLLVEGGWV